jgi:hypothetical protein
LGGNVFSASFGHGQNPILGRRLKVNLGRRSRCQSLGAPLSPHAKKKP